MIKRVLKRNNIISFVLAFLFTMNHIGLRGQVKWLVSPHFVH